MLSRVEAEVTVAWRPHAKLAAAVRNACLASARAYASAITSAVPKQACPLKSRSPMVPLPAVAAHKAAVLCNACSTIHASLKVYAAASSTSSSIRVPGSSMSDRVAQM